MDRITQEAHARQRFLEYFLKHGNGTDTAIRYKISRKTLYKWLKRYDGTWQSLVEQSRRPHNSPRAHTAEEMRQIRRLAKKHHWEDLIIAYQEMREKYGYRRSYGGFKRMAFNTLPSRREELVVQRERLLTGEIGRIDALLKTLDGQQDRLEERLEVLASQVPEDEEPMNTTVVDEVGSTQVITSEMDEAAFLRSQIVEIRRRKDILYAERAEHANTEVQIRLLLELVDEMVKNSLPEWMAREGQPEEEQTGTCRDYDDFFSRTKYTVPEGVLDENGRMEAFNNDLVIRYLDKVVVKDDGYEVAFKAGVTVEVEV